MTPWLRIGLIVGWVSVAASAQAQGESEAEPHNPFADGSDADGYGDGDADGDEHNPFVNNDPPPDPNAGDGTCVPDCQPGYVCFHGQCSSRCDPACPAGQRCNASLTCEVDPAAVCPPGTERSAAGVCVSTVPHAPCQVGMVRTPAGTCVPSGNTSCPPGMVVSPSGCVPSGGGSGVVPPPCPSGTMRDASGRCAAPRAPIDPRPRARSAARGRGVASVLGSVLVLGTGIATGIGHRRGDPAGTSRDCEHLRCYPSNPGAAAFGFSLLQTASQVAFGLLGSPGGRQARRAGATGTSAFATAGWVAWALSTAGQLGLLVSHGVAFGNDDVTDVPPAIMYVTTIIGFASLLSFAIDAFIGAGSIPEDRPEETEASDSTRAWAPILRAGPEPGGARGELGVALQF